MAAMTALAIGAGLSGVGGAMSARAQKKAAAAAAGLSQFNPWGITGAGGSVTVDDASGQMNVADDQQTAMFRNLFGGQAQNLLNGGGFGAGAQQYADVAGTQGLMNAFNSQNMWSDPSSAIGAGNLFSQFSAGNALYGQQAGMNAMSQANRFGNSQTGINEGNAQALFGFGQDALNNTDFNQLTSNFIDRQRAFARPGEERAVNSKFGNLFNRGVLSSTGGERQVGELALTQEMADIQRVNAGEQFGNMVQQQNRNFGLNAMGAGLQARGMDQQYNMGMANMFGNMGMNLMNFGQQSGQAGFNTQLGLNQLVNSRGQQRLQNAQGLLGFGGQLSNNNLNQAMALFGGIRGMNADQRALMSLSGNLGSEGAAAGARAGNFMMQGAGSPLGSFLGGLGGGMMQYGMGGLGGAGNAAAGQSLQNTISGFQMPQLQPISWPSTG